MFMHILAFKDTQSRPIRMSRKGYLRQPGDIQQDKTTEVLIERTPSALNQRLVQKSTLALVPFWFGGIDSWLEGNPHKYLNTSGSSSSLPGSSGSYEHPVSGFFYVGNILLLSVSYRELHDRLEAGNRHAKAVGMRINA